MYMLDTAVCLNHYEVISEVRDGISEGECPVDLMADIQKEKADGEMIVFTLTSEAIRMMCAYDSLKDIRYFKRLPFGYQGVGVWWLPEDPCEEVPEKEQEWMNMWTHDMCKTYFVEEVHTQEIKYKIPPKGSKVTHHIIG